MAAMERSIARCAAALLVALLAAAPAARAAEQGKLLVWINGDKGYTGLQKVGDAFAKVSGVPVTVEHPEAATDKFQQAAGAGKGPDIWCWPHDRIGEWIQGGLIVPITPGKKVKDAIDPQAWKAFTFDQKLWGYPLSLEAIGLVYNKALVKTPPKTFDDVVKLDQALRKQGKHAILWDYNTPYFSWPILAANGGYVFKRNPDGSLDPTQVGVNTPGAVKGAELLAALLDKGVMPRGATYSTMEAGFAGGTLAMMITGPWAWDNARKAKIDFGVGTIPAVGTQPGRPFVGVLGCMIAAPSPNKDLAKEFLENHVLTLEGLKTIDADVSLGVPANKAFFAEKAKDPHIKATMANAQLGEPMPNIPEMGKFWAALESALQNITSGQQSPRAALDGAAARITGKEATK